MTENENLIPPSLAAEPTHHGLAVPTCNPRFPGVVPFISLDWKRVTCPACKLEQPMPKPEDRYFLTGAGADALKRYAALARADRYRVRLAQVEAVIEQSRETMIVWAQRLGEAMALRERIAAELSEAQSAVDSFGVPMATPEAPEPVRKRSAGGSYGPGQPRLRLVDTVPGGRPIAKPGPY